ncbi:MAG: RluA family pseudouridine synthase [Lachnospiraceae bacterium]|nr:RluA family pseudouridine synthase [Lachnospiraceae bacterium]
MKVHNISITEDYEDIRIDKYLADFFPDYSRSYIQQLIKDNLVKVNHNNIKSSYRLTMDDILEISIPDPKILEITPQNLDLDIIYEDEDIIIINKPKGMVVHPSAGHYENTLVNGLLYHCKDSLSSINGILRPGIVHRIDMDTTGVLVVCKNNASHQFISDQLKVHSITRKYHAIVCHNLGADSGTIEGAIGRNPNDRKKMAITPNGKPAITHYTVLDHLNRLYNYVECMLETGRTHQIRVHMASIHHPLLGDTVYGSTKNEFKLQGQTLHAKVLGFIHPRTKEYVEFEAPLPEYFQHLLIKLGN